MVVFLLSAIGATVFKKADITFVSKDSEIILSETDNSNFVAVVADTESLSREQKLESMRQKIAAGQSLSISEPEPEVEEIDEEESEEVQVEPGSPILCPDYKEFTHSWVSQGLMIEDVEGSKLVYREVEKETIQLVGTSTFATSTSLVKETVLQLPLRYGPSVVPSCMSSDVVGIAKDGSLIRNNEAALYGVFDEGTLIGYALDGFPIYGTTNKPLDSCGGTGNYGNYRYYLSSERESVLNCFSSSPTKM